MLFLLGVRIYRVPLYFLIYYLELFAGCFGLQFYVYKNGKNVVVVIDS